LRSAPFSAIPAFQQHSADGVGERHMTEPLNHHEALFYVMVDSSAVDRDMTHDEFARICEMVSNLPVFADCDEEGLVKAAEACGKILSADDGLQQVVRLGRGGVPRETREAGA